MKVTILIPAYNEELGIGPTLDGIPTNALEAAGYTSEKLVVDNASTDRTAEVARIHGARVIHESKQGKGNAIRAGFYNISDDTDFVVMLDGDNTYKSHEVLRLLEPLASGFSDVITGSRMGGKIKPGSMDGFNRLGNWIFSFLVRLVYKANTTDVLTGYFAWKRDVIIKLRPHLKSNGFAIEMEMVTKMARLGYQIYSVPISYEPRMGESSLQPIRSGLGILSSWLQHLTWKPRPQRIAYVSDAIYPYHRGGKETRLNEITKRLVKDGREVHIYTMKWWDGPSSIVRDGVHLHAVSKLYPLYKHDRRSITEAIMFALACFKLLFIRFDIADVDSIPFFPLFSMRLVCWIKRKDMYATWHEVWGQSYWRQYLGLSSKFGALTEKMAMKLPDVIISNSQHTTDGLVGAGVKIDIRTIPLGVDLAKIYAAPRHTLRSDVVYVGRLLPHKNVDLLIKAIAIVKEKRPDIFCIIVGRGPEREKLERLTDNLDLRSNVVFFNNIDDNTELYGLMKSSKVFVQPSVREGFGLVVVEANACGLPVITTSHAQNAAKDLIETGKNGLLTKADSAEIAKCIAQILGEKRMHPEKLMQEMLDRYHWKNIAAQVEEIFEA